RCPVESLEILATKVRDHPAQARACRLSHRHIDDLVLWKDKRVPRRFDPIEQGRGIDHDRECATSRPFNQTHPADLCILVTLSPRGIDLATLGRPVVLLSPAGSRTPYRRGAEISTGIDRIVSRLKTIVPALTGKRR